MSYVIKCVFVLVFLSGNIFAAEEKEESRDQNRPLSTNFEIFVCGNAAQSFFSCLSINELIVTMPRVSSTIQNVVQALVVTRPSNLWFLPYSRTEAMFKFLEANSGRDNLGNSYEGPLHYLATQDGAREPMVALLAGGFDINSQGLGSCKYSKNTPLHRALMSNQMDNVQFLLEEKADLNTRNKNNRTPLRLAIEMDSTEVVALLLEHGASAVDTFTGFPEPLNWGYMQATYLDIAADGGNSECCKLILDSLDKEGYNKANFLCSEQNNYAYKPIHFAATRGHQEVVALLLEAKSNPTVRNQDSKINALDIAVMSGHVEVVEALLNGEKEFDVTALIVALKRSLLLNHEPIARLILNKITREEFIMNGYLTFFLPTQEKNSDDVSKSFELLMTILGIQKR